MVASAGLLVLLLHFTFIISNSLRKELSTKWDYWAYTYTYPFMHQDWKLFVPPPACNYKVYVLDDHGTHDVFNEVLLLHRKALLSGHGHLLISFANLIHYFEKNALLQHSGTSKVENDLYFGMLLHAVSAYENHAGRNFSGKLIVVVHNVADGSSRVFYN